MPEISVIVNNCNYGRFLSEAVNSVLAQDYRDFELIVVDDGSTDDSRRIMESVKDERVRCVFKENGGQLSAFNAGFLKSSGEILCFLDADDMYPPGYLRAVVRMFGACPDCGCLLAKQELFGNASGVRSGGSGRLGCNPFSVAVRHVWIGAPTSAYSIRRRFAEKFLPRFEDERAWKTRADDLLVWGAELAGAVKYALPAPPIRYRVHGKNLFFGKKDFTGDELAARRKAAEKFCRDVMAANGLDYASLLRRENACGGLSFFSRCLSYLKFCRLDTVTFREKAACGGILLGGLIFGSRGAAVADETGETGK